jgi:mannose-6-phosphate isomerase-like protein (cupin superfamily)
MTLSDQVVVLNEGKVEQIGPPLDVYEVPDTSFVASFLGRPSMNLVRVNLETDDSAVRGLIPADRASLLTREVVLGFRLEAVEVGAPDQFAVSARLQLIERQSGQRVERGTLSPSIEVLWRIALALELQIGMLFDGLVTTGEGGSSAPDGSALRRPARAVRRDGRKTLGLAASHVRYELLSPDLQGKLEFVRMVVAPGHEMPSTNWSHQGEETILVLEGRAVLRYGDERFALDEGDAITFDSSVPHLLENPGDRPVVAISAATPPSF